MSGAAPELSCGRVALRARQRARILDAVVEVVAERGLAGASIAAVLAQAKVSRGAFYELFGNLDEALVSVIDETLELISLLATRELQQKRAWQDGLRAVLAEVLRFLDSRPALARVCIVEVLGAGPVVLARRERNMGTLRALISEHLDPELRASPTLAVEGLMAAVVGIVHARLVTREPEPLIGLLGPLMALIVGAQLGTRAAASEIERGDRLAQAMLADPGRLSQPPAGKPVLGPGVPALLRDPAAYRVRLCLLYVAEWPGASNRQIAGGIGVSHQGQASALLKRLVSEGLLVKQSMGVGRRNIWRLTADGDTVAGLLRPRGEVATVSSRDHG
jgi:AcrR family transcriptional regulator